VSRRGCSENDHWVNQEQDGGRPPEEYVTDPRNNRMEETSRIQRIMEASSKGGQCPEGAVVP